MRDKERGQVDSYYIVSIWCCYVTVDSAMAASGNGFNSYKLYIRKKINIMQIMTKNTKFYLFNLSS